jgi:hypothetical protein
VVRLPGDARNLMLRIQELNLSRLDSSEDP